MTERRQILLIIGGGIAAYKALEFIRLAGKADWEVTCVTTRAAEQFVTPLSVSALSGNRVYRDLFDLTDEAEMGHIQLSRAADLVVVAPATADLLAKMAGGHADDLASTLLMATDTPVLVAPAMNVRMWEHPAMRRNLAILREDGIATVGPDEGEMACGEYGPGRMAAPEEIVAAARRLLIAGPLTGRRILITSGPTHEPIDPVRYIANRSSGTQGTAIAEALMHLGAEVIFVTGPASAPRPHGAEIVEVETARQMHDAAMSALPVDAAIFAAAVADWRVENASSSKMKKDGSGRPPALQFSENPDILQAVGRLEALRPRLVVGFAAETDDVLANATAKRVRKGCDWIFANNVRPETGIMGGWETALTRVSAAGHAEWPRMSKALAAERIAREIAEALA